MIEPRFVVLGAFVLMTASNIVSTTSTIYNNTNNTQISNENPTTLTPDGITFAIWGLIYLLEACTSVFQCWAPDNTVFNDSSRRWLAMAFVLNAVWLPVFAYEYWWLSLLIISGYLVALVELYSWHMHIDYADENPWHVKLFAYGGISVNLAWVTVATLLNITIVCRNSGIMMVTTHDEIVGGNPDWAVAAIVLAAVVAANRVVHNADILYGMATAWALFGIHRHQNGKQTVWAQTHAIILLVLCALRGIAWLVTKKQHTSPLHNNLLGHPSKQHE